MVKLPKARIVCTTSKAETSPDVLFYRYEIPSMPLPFKLAFSSLRVIIEIEKVVASTTTQRRTVKKTVARILFAKRNSRYLPKYGRLFLLVIFFEDFIAQTD
ncbi:hypothetical protein [Streptococcus suis]|uniref:hypothetical protein n=1 Tax=Streptococcus suis TaxID=1307 RepID=UPI003756816C